LITLTSVQKKALKSWLVILHTGQPLLAQTCHEETIQSVSDKLRKQGGETGGI